MKPVLIVSYPKSGNTWIRLILSRYVNKYRKLDINRIDIAPMSVAKKVLGRENMNENFYTSEELLHMRKKMYHSKDIDKQSFLKVHDYNIKIDNQLVFPDDMKKIVVVRNPLDVAVSFMHHMGPDNLDTVIDKMKDPSFKIKGYSTQIEQHIGAWDMNVNSWITAETDNILLIKYEDMINNLENEIKRIFTFLDYTYTDEFIKTIISAVTFNKLQEQESSIGFKEKAPKQEQFFRKGVVGDYRNYMNENQIKRILEAFGPTMVKVGYSDRLEDYV